MRVAEGVADRRFRGAPSLAMSNRQRCTLTTLGLQAVKATSSRASEPSRPFTRASTNGRQGEAAELRPVSSARPASVRRGSDRSLGIARSDAKSRRQKRAEGVRGPIAPKVFNESLLPPNPSLARARSGAGAPRANARCAAPRRPTRGWPREGKLRGPERSEGVQEISLDRTRGLGSPALSPRPTAR